MPISKRATPGAVPSRATLLSALCLLPLACGGKAIIDGAAGSGGATTTTNDGGSGTGTTVVSTAVGSTTVDVSSSVSSSTGVGGAPKIPPLIEVDYGDMPTGTTVLVDIPPNMLGFTAVATTPNLLDTIGIETLTAPDMTAIVTEYGMPNTYAGYYGAGISAVAVPQTSQLEEMPVQGGQWPLTLGDGDSPTQNGHVTTWIRQTLDGNFHGGLIDVNLFAVDGVADEAYMKDQIQTAFGEYAGLTLGTITVFPLADSYWEVNDGNFYQGFEETKGAPGKPSLNILAVGYLGGSLDGAAGVTPGAPAMPIYHGTHLSGFYWMVLQDGFFDPVILKHETGHLAGLFHTSEFDAGVGDLLDDTPFCPDVMAQGGGCPDSDNLMFPTGGDGSLTLTPQQLAVIHGSVLYRGIVEDGGGPALPLDQPMDGGGQGAIASPSQPAPAARAFSRFFRGAAARKPWASGLPRGMAEHLAGIGCPSGSARTPGAPGSARFYDTLDALGGDDPAQLLSIGTDPSAPSLVRMRALAGAGRASPSAEEIELLVAVAESREPRAVRIGALRGVAAASKSDALALADRLGGDADPAVAHVARGAASR